MSENVTRPPPWASQRSERVHDGVLTCISTKSGRPPSGRSASSTLQLAPGLNVVHGPNEAGKSSWFAATYAGLAGRRKARGRGTIAQADFRNRHKPWSGSQWSAGVTVTLDDGLVLALEHDLNKGESRIVDSETGRVVSDGASSRSAWAST